MSSATAATHVWFGTRCVILKTPPTCCTLDHFISTASCSVSYPNPVTRVSASIREARARVVVICISVVLAYDRATGLVQPVGERVHVCTGTVRTAAGMPRTSADWCGSVVIARGQSHGSRRSPSSTSSTSSSTSPRNTDIYI